jgi:hypothetical protein
VFAIGLDQPENFNTMEIAAITSDGATRSVQRWQLKMVKVKLQ